VLFGTMALVTPFMQNVLGYPILTAGMLLGSRGIGTMMTMMAAPRLMKHIESRYLILVGLLLTAGTLYEMVGFTTDTQPSTIVTISIIQGIGLGLLFVPVTSVGFATLPGHLRTSGTSMMTLVRNIGSSIGISMVIANLTSKTTLMHARLTESVTPFNDALQMQDIARTLDMNTDLGRAILDRIVTEQASVIAYANDFKLLMILAIATIPLVFLISTSRASPPQASAAHAMD
jgi:DHA2 family multidrug resistance protein